jgi:hypothetical protein
MECVNLTAFPSEKWYCPGCRKKFHKGENSNGLVGRGSNAKSPHTSEPFLTKSEKSRHKPESLLGSESPIRDVTPTNIDADLVLGPEMTVREKKKIEMMEKTFRKLEQGRNVQYP